MISCNMHAHAVVTKGYQRQKGIMARGAIYAYTCQQTAVSLKSILTPLVTHPS